MQQRAKQTDKQKAVAALKQATAYLAIASAMLSEQPGFGEAADKLLSGAARLYAEVERYGKA